MRTLHINTEKSWRGGERQTVFLAEGLARQGLEVHLVCQPGSPLAERSRSSEITVWLVAMRGEADLAAALALRRLIQKYRYDIVHSHTSHAHTLAFWATIGLNVVRLVTRRVEYSIFRNSFFGLNRIKYRRMADAYIAISDRIRQVLIADGIPDKMIRVVPSGVITDPASDGSSGLRAEFGVGNQNTVLLSVAHLTPEKGHEILLEAMKLVVERMPSARLIILGEGERQKSLEVLADQIGQGNEVIFAGFRSDVSDFYDLADVYVSSSLAEGLGSSILDALAAGVPVVATAVGGIPEYIDNGKTGLLVPAADPQALARAVIDQIQNPEQARAMAHRGKEIIRQRFSVEKMIGDTVAYYEDLLQ